MADYPYQVFDINGVCVMHAPESCRYSLRQELLMLEAGYSIRLNGAKLSIRQIRNELKKEKS